MAFLAITIRDITAADGTRTELSYVQRYVTFKEKPIIVYQREQETA
jgi:hypothetical protein